MNERSARLLANIGSGAYLIPLLVRGIIDPAWRKTVSERLGFGDWREFPLQPKRDLIWLHGASVGEIGGFVPVKSAIDREFSDSQIVVTTTSITGKREVMLRKLCERPCLLPFDHPWVLERIVKKLAPKVVVLTETELWPNLLFLLARANIPVLLINGRISDFSFPLYYRTRSFFRPCLAAITQILAQTEQDASRFIALGADPERVQVAGSTKYDQELKTSSPATLAKLAAGLGLSPERPCFIAGSIRPEEDASVIAAYVTARSVIPELQMIIAPRHPERFDEVGNLLRRYDISFHRRSFGQAFGQTAVVLLDTLGELRSIYALGTCAFVGGTLVNFGGHNPLEPAAYRVPVIVGPHTANVRDAAGELKKRGALLEVRSSDQLADAIVDLCRDVEKRRWYGETAYRVLQGNLGATKNVMKWLRRFLLDYEAAKKELRLGN